MFFYLVVYFYITLFACIVMLHVVIFIIFVYKMNIIILVSCWHFSNRSYFRRNDCYAYTITRADRSLRSLFAWSLT